MAKDAESYYWTSLNLREQIVSSYEAMTRTALQRIFEIQQFKITREKALGAKMTPAALAKAFSENAKLAASSDAVTESCP